MILVKQLKRSQVESRGSPGIDPSSLVKMTFQLLV